MKLFRSRFGCSFGVLLTGIVLSNLQVANMIDKLLFEGLLEVTHEIEVRQVRFLFDLSERLWRDDRESLLSSLRAECLGI